MRPKLPSRDAPTSRVHRGGASPAKTARPEAAPERYVGVAWEKGARKWAAKIWVNDLGRVERIAQFDDARSAAVARDRVALYLAGPRGRQLNFPEMRLRPASIAQIRAERREEHRKAREARAGTGFVGVYGHEVAGEMRWTTQISIDGRLVQVGTWDTQRAAALAYDRVSLLLKGHAVNLPIVAERLGPASVEDLRAQASRANKEMKTSQYRGVHWAKASRKWRASIRINGVPKNLGLFTSEEEAARAYDRAARKAWGSGARVNFP